MEETYHPILNRPWEYSIQEIHWGRLDPVDDGLCLDITFVKGEQRRRLRFLSPSDVKIELLSCPQQCGEMILRDIRDRGWEGRAVQIAEGGASGSPVLLYAKEVIDLDK